MLESLRCRKVQSGTVISSVDNQKSWYSRVVTCLKSTTTRIPEIQPDETLTLESEIEELQRRIAVFDQFVREDEDLRDLFSRLVTQHSFAIAQPPPIPETEDQILALKLKRNTYEHLLNERIYFVRSHTELLESFKTCFEKHGTRQDWLLLTTGSEGV